MNYKGHGFTIIEILLVLVISFILAALAMPRFFGMVEYSRATEALSAMDMMRTTVERCYLRKGGITYEGCTAASNMGMDDPSETPGSHFDYEIIANGNEGFSIKAVRNTLDSGDPDDYILITQSQDGVTRMGAGSFKDVQ